MHRGVQNRYTLNLIEQASWTIDLIANDPNPRFDFDAPITPMRLSG